MVNIGVIGYGYWGPNLVRNFSGIPEAQVRSVADLDQQRLGLLKTRFPAIETTTDCRTLISDPSIDAVVIATPVSSHFELALQALRGGKHVFIEKPLTETAEQAEQLIAEADTRGLVLARRSHLHIHQRCAQDSRPGSVWGHRRAVLLRFRESEPRPVSIGCGRDVGLGGSRLVHYGLRVSIDADRGFRLGSQAC